MAGALMSSITRRREIVRRREQKEILDGLLQVKSDLAQAYSAFNTAGEPELVEASVFQINSLQARYAYYLRRAKEFGALNIETFKFPREGYEGKRC